MVAMSGCSTTPPANPENLCDIFREKSDWYKDSVRMSEKWGVPIQVPMAMMYQESSFRHDAKPPKDYIFFGLIPWGRVSSAYGYSQAKTMTWADYQRETGQSGSRSDFGDAIDFMGWFITKTHKINGVSKWDAYAQYLNYHEGWGGYRRKTYNRKAWLKDVARKVERRASTYGTQLRSCKDELDGGFWNWLFG
ncbi:hypothetical protein NAF29_12465 [Echinimonas agarilytica]|uniref:Transglycosylase SLT domain-containing protein n=2 Tax=Echinimonas agarilytica TaxID=1215918 RepID=A0AA41W975_9GAMM|nr:hypothetical protein [Echinimonas agarilytica]